jgi:hypothetical protein
MPVVVKAKTEIAAVTPVVIPDIEIEPTSPRVVPLVPSERPQMRYPLIVQIKPGLEKARITQMYGNPSLKATTGSNGHTIDTFVYDRDRGDAVTIIRFEDGKVYWNPAGTSGVAGFIQRCIVPGSVQSEATLLRRFRPFVRGDRMRGGDCLKECFRFRAFEHKTAYRTCKEDVHLLGGFDIDARDLREVDDVASDLNELHAVIVACGGSNRSR